MIRPMPNFRDAHTWLRGYSDALAGKPRAPQDFQNPDVYDRGYSSANPRQEGEV